MPDDVIIGICIAAVVFCLFTFELWWIFMTSFMLTLVACVASWHFFVEPWNIVVPVTLSILWIIRKLGGLGGGRSSGDWFDSDGGGFGGGDGGGGGD